MNHHYVCNTSVIHAISNTLRVFATTMEAVVRAPPAINGTVGTDPHSEFAKRTSCPVTVAIAADRVVLSARRVSAAR